MTSILLRARSYSKLPLPLPLPHPLLLPPALAAPQDEDTHASLRQLLSSARGRLTVACNILALVGMAPFVVIEVGWL